MILATHQDQEHTSKQGREAISQQGVQVLQTEIFSTSSTNESCNSSISSKSSKTFERFLNCEMLSRIFITEFNFPRT